MMHEPGGPPRGHGPGMRVAAVAMLTLLVSVALMAAGCGGGDSSNTSANDAYASSVCTAIGTWENQVKSIATNLTGGISKASLQSAVTQAETATKTLATEVAAVPPPDSSEGQAAKQQVDQLSSSLTSTVELGQVHRRPDPEQRLDRDHRGGAGRARAAGEEPRDHGPDHAQLAPGRRRVTRLRVQEQLVLPKPR